MNNPYKKTKRNGRCVYVHRELMAKAIGRPLRRDEHVHHVNENKHDNRLENLEIKSPVEHTRLHLMKNPIEKTCWICGDRFRPPQPHRGRDRACGIRCRNVSVMIARLGLERFASIDVVGVLSRLEHGESARSIARSYSLDHHTILRIGRWSPAFAEAVARAIREQMQKARIA
jgi:hypothetical protein